MRWPWVLGICLILPLQLALIIFLYFPHNVKISWVISWLIFWFHCKIKIKNFCSESTQNLSFKFKWIISFLYHLKFLETLLTSLGQILNEKYLFLSENYNLVLNWRYQHSWNQVFLFWKRPEKCLAIYNIFCIFDQFTEPVLLTNNFGFFKTVKKTLFLFCTFHLWGTKNSINFD